jgi:hypothetical protein
MYVGHGPTIHMLLLKLKIPPENAHNSEPVKKYSLWRPVKSTSSS